MILLVIVQILDADNGQRLESSTGRVATQDIVQFVPMREVHGEFILFFSVFCFTVSKTGNSLFTSLGDILVQGFALIWAG